MKVSEIASWLDLPAEGDGGLNILQGRAARHRRPRRHCLRAATQGAPRGRRLARGCLIVPEDFDNAEVRTVIRAGDPRAAFARVVARLHPPARPQPGIHPKRARGGDGRVGRDVSIGPFVVVSKRPRSATGRPIGAHCFIGAGARIGADSTLHARVTLYPHTLAGARAILHSGVVLGADGFGFNRTPQGYEKFPQIGRVILGDDVELGANCTVDRAALGATEIGDGTKFDDMVTHRPQLPDRPPCSDRGANGRGRRLGD